MAVKEPKSMDELVYFTRRNVGEGKVSAWVYRGICPECKKGTMGKPINPKTKKPMTRSLEYECPECKFSMPKEEYEDTLECEIKYVCPKCKKEDTEVVPFKRKKVKFFDVEKQKDVSADAIVFNCKYCGEKVSITKKMK